MALASALRAEIVTYGYNAAGRLIGADYNGSASITYTYDSAGNLLRETRTVLTDSDTNGLGDDWEIQYFKHLGVDPKDDPDGDGMTNLREFMAGTNPTNSLSVLRMTPVSQPSNVSFTLAWHSIPGKYYRVQFNDSLAPDGWKDLGGDVLAEDVTASKTDENAPANSTRYYRVLVLF